MARPLTAVTVANFKPDPTRRLEIADVSTPGLRLVVQPTGIKSWAFRYEALGRRPVKITFGPAAGPGKLSLAEARDEAGKARKLITSGVDPAEHRKLEKAAEAARLEAERRAAEREVRSQEDRIESVLDRYVVRHVERKKRKSACEIKRLFEKEVKPVWKGRRVQEITRKDVRQLVENIGVRGAPTTANRTLSNVRTFFNWCLDEEFIDSSPCQRVKPFKKEVARDRALSDDELRLLTLGIARLEWPWRQFFSVALLTAQRRQEVAGMSWDELDLTAQTPMWKLPAARTKNSRPHDVPLLPEAVRILQSVPRVGNSKLVFTTTGETSISGFSHAKIDLDAAMLAVAREEAEGCGDDPTKVKISPWRLHDFRRTAATVMARLGTSIAVIEKVLNHVSGTFGGIVGVYQRHDFMSERTRALEVWAGHVEAQTQPVGSNVLPFRAEA